MYNFFMRPFLYAYIIMRVYILTSKLNSFNNFPFELKLTGYQIKNVIFNIKFNKTLYIF